MNLPALKDGVSKDKMSTPRTLRTRDVMLDSFTSNIANTSKEFTRTPEMSFPKVSPQPRMLFEDSICRITFKQLERLRNTHGIRNFNKKMYIVWLNTQLINLKSILFSYLSNNLVTKFSKFIKLKRIFSIFWFPHKVKGVLSSSVSKLSYFHFLFSYAKFKNTAHTTKRWFDVCTYSVAHSFSFFENIIRWRFGLPRAKAQGILQM